MPTFSLQSTSLEKIGFLSTIRNWVRHGMPLIDQMFASGGNFLTIAVSANILNPVEHGKLGYVFAAYMITIVFNIVVIFQWASVQASKQAQPLTYQAVLARSQLFTGFLTSLLIVMTFVALGSAISWKMNFLESIVFFFFLFFQQLADFIRRSAYIFADASRAAASSSILYSIRVVLLLLVFPRSILDVLYVLLFSSLLPVLIFFWGVSSAKNLRIRDVLKQFTEHCKGTGWLVLSGPLAWLVSYLPVFFLGSISGPAKVAVLVSILSLVGIANMLMEILETEVASKAAQLYNNNNEHYRLYLAEVLICGLLLWLGALFFLLFLSRYILLMVFGPNYLPYGNIFVMLWVSQGITFLFRVNGVRCRIEGKLFAVVFGFICGAVAVGVFGYPLIKLLGLIGGATLYVIGASSIFLGQYISLRMVKS